MYSLRHNTRSCLIDQITNPSNIQISNINTQSNSISTGSPRFNANLKRTGKPSTNTHSVQGSCPKFISSRGNEIKSVCMISSVPASTVTFLTSMANLHLMNALFILDEALQECMTFHNIFGYSSFDSENCSITMEGKLILTQNSQSNLNKETKQEETVLKMISQVSQIAQQRCMEDFICYFNRNQLKNKCDYKYTRSLIRSYCQCSKTKMPTTFDFSLNSSHNILTPYMMRSGERQTSIMQSKSDHSNRGIKLTASECKDENDFKLLMSSRSQGKIIESVKNIKKSADCTQINKFSNRKMTKSNQILSQVHLLAPCTTSIIAKQSQTSTQNPTQTHHESSKGNQSDSSLILQSIQKHDSNYNRPLLSVSLSLVQSQCESSTQYQRVSQPISENEIKKENEDFMNNNWVRRVDNLFGNVKDVSESFIEGKQVYAVNDGPTPQSLGRMARVMCESYLGVEKEQK